MTILVDVVRLCRVRKLLTVILAGAAFGLSIQVAAAGDVPPIDQSACPTELPAGADPAAWRCEVLTTDATATIGALGPLANGAARLTFAEGTLDGQYAQVFGALRAEPTPVPGGLLGRGENPLLRLGLPGTVRRGVGLPGPSAGHGLRRHEAQSDQPAAAANLFYWYG